jgi:hypothetical protein
MCTSDPALSRNKVIRVLSDAWHPGDEVKYYEQVTGREVTVERHPAKVRPRAGILYPRLFSDEIFTVNPALWDNAKWPEVRPFTLKAYVEKEFGKGAKM